MVNLFNKRQGISYLLCFFFCVVVFDIARAQAITSGENISLAQAPGWVARASIPETNEDRLAQVQNGVHYLMFDNQARLEGQHHTYYRRSVMQVINRSGLESAARLQFAFDPDEQSFIVHKIQLTRDGVATDRLDIGGFIVARQEADMASGVTNGTLTAYYEIADVRVGDIIEYEVSWEIRSKLWPGQYTDTFSTQWAVPLGFGRNRILIPQSKTLTIKNRGTQEQPSITEAGGFREYVWRQDDPVIVEAQDALPPTFANWGEVSVSTFSEWAQVADSLTTHYNEGLDLPADFASKHDWFSDGSNQNEKITAAIRYVQDQIRYVADATGVGSHLPRKPSEVIKRGWGDCKDKSLLLVAILRKLGIDAHVTLTDIDGGYALPDVAPSPYAFDHAIVVYTVHGTSYWIDPTNYEQGGVFPNIEQPFYGYGLPIRPGSNRLLEIQPQPQDSPTKTITEIFDFSGFEDDGVQLQVETHYSGVEADGFRRILSSRASGQLSRDYLNYYQEIYPGIQSTADLEISDDREANLAKTIETYNLAREHYAEKDIETAFPLRADAVLNTIGNINFDGRSAPIALPYPANYQHVITLKDIGVDFEGPAPFASQSDYFEFSRSYTSNGNGASLFYALKTTAPEAALIAADEYQAVVKDLNDFGVLEYNQFADAPSVGLYEMLAAFFLSGIVIGLVYLPFAINARLKRDEKTMAQSVFFPVSITKFTILNIASLTLYTPFWMWRCWRWVRTQREDTIKPLWRAFFAAFWFYAIFDEIRSRQTPTKTPVYIGAFLAAGYLLVSVGSNIMDRVFEEDTGMLFVSIAVSLTAFLFAIPLVKWVNDLNTHETNKENSRWSPHTVGALAVGLMFVGLVVMGAIAAPLE